MSFLDALRYRWRVLTRPNDHETELAQDMEFFVNTDAQHRAHAGRGTLTPDDARAAAARRFGNRTYYREESRRAAGLAFFDVLAQDARFALRTFARTPGFTAVVIATLAIGIGANTALFSAVNTLLLAPLPFRAPDQLMNVTLTVPPTSTSPGQPDMVWSYPKVEALRESQNVFTDLTAWFSVQSTLRIDDDALRVSGEFIDQHYFTTLGVAPSLGRALLPAENRVDGPAVVIISDDLWRSTFNADPSVIGKRIGVDLAVFTIIGVAPPRFAGVSGRAEFWVPFLSAPSAWDAGFFTDPYQHTFHVIARLAPGVTPDRAAAVSRQLGPRIDARFPEPGPRPRHWGVAARSLDATRIDEPDRRTLYLLFGAVSIVLLVACANVANLFLVRAAGRRREIGVRLAIGASRVRIVRQLLVESVLLALAGGVASVAVAAVGVRVISAVRPALWSSQSASGIGTVLAGPMHLDVVAFAFAGAVAIATGLLFGLVPAVQATRTDLAESLKVDPGAGRRSAFSRRISVRDALTMLQIALAVVLLAGSGVLVRSLMNLVAVSPGFEPRGVLTMRVNRAAAWSRDSIARFYDVAIDRLRSVPGVTQAAMADCTPQSGGCVAQEVTALDHAGGPYVSRAAMHWVTARWDEVLRVPVLRGRSIAETDRKGAPVVAVVSQSAARALWPNADALGKRLLVQGRDTAVVVGVVGDVRFGAMEEGLRPDVYISYYQFPMSFRMMLMLRASGDPAALTEVARRAVREVAPGFPLYDIATLDTRMGASLGQARFLAQLLSVFAVLAVGLATIGTYGVIAHTVAKRTREMGIRLALGATPRDVARLVVGQGAVLAAIGGLVGLAGGFAAVRLLRARLYGVGPNDAVTMIGVVAVLLVVVLVASWMPARRAAAVPAVNALRAD